MFQSEINFENQLNRGGHCTKRRPNAETGYPQVWARFLQKSLRDPPLTGDQSIRRRLRSTVVQLLGRYDLYVERYDENRLIWQICSQ